jgi:hypothetical protein
MDALSLSHLTYCCATIKVCFHRLDHPPFPCKSRLPQRRFQCKFPRIALKHKPSHPIHPVTPTAASEDESLRWTPERHTHEGSYDRRNSTYHSRHHRIRHWRSLLHARKERRRSRSGAGLAQDAEHAAHLADPQHDLASRGHRPCRGWRSLQVVLANTPELHIGVLVCSASAARGLPISSRRAPGRSGLRQAPGSAARARPAADAAGCGLRAPRPSGR